MKQNKRQRRNKILLNSNICWMGNGENKELLQEIEYQSSDVKEQNDIRFIRNNSMQDTGIA